MSKASGMFELRGFSEGAFEMSPGFENEAGFSHEAGKRATAEYWAIFAVCYPLFLLIAAVKRFMPSSWSQGSYYSASRNGGRQESINGEAYSQASTAATYAFMG